MDVKYLRNLIGGSLIQITKSFYYNYNEFLTINCILLNFLLNRKHGSNLFINLSLSCWRSSKAANN